MRKAGIFSFLILVISHFDLQALELVRDGKPSSEIVISEKPLSSVKTAAGELQKYIKKISGAELPIVTKPTGRVPIYVGTSEYTDKLGIKIDDIKYDGFKIIVKDKYAAILGRDQERLPIPRNNTKFGMYKELQKEWEAYTGHKWEYPRIARDPRNANPEYGFHLYDATGTLYAVYDFLESLGMRWYMPMEEIGQVIPELKTINVSPVELKKEPNLAARTLALTGAAKNPSEFLWTKYLRQGGMFDNWPAHSSCTVTKFQQDRPELLGFSGGKPIQIGRDEFLPKLSSPQLREELTEYLIKTQATFPEMPYMPIGQPDGWLILDEKDAAAGWDKKEEGNWGRFSDYTWDFVIDVAKRVNQKKPDMKFCTMSYGYSKKTPKNIDKIPANIAIYFTQNSTVWHMQHCEGEPALRQEWIKKAPDSDFFIYDYYLFHAPNRNNPPAPSIFTELMEKNFKNMPEQFKGIYVEIAYGPSFKQEFRMAYPGLNHLMLYLHGKFTWDKNIDMKAILDEYYEKFYGPAKAEMKEFFEYSEKVWMRPDTRQVTSNGGFIKPEDVGKYFDILGRAKAKAGDSIYGKRIDLIAGEMEPVKKLFESLKRTGHYVRMRKLDITTEANGDLTKDFWTKNYTKEILWLKDVKGGEAKVKTSVAFRWLPDSSLLVGITCYENKMNSIKAITSGKIKDDNAIYNDDNIELHLATPEGFRAKIVVNPNGAVFDQCITPDATDVPDAWNAEKVAVKKLEDRWTVEIKVKGIGNMPTKAFPWGVNVFRQRLTDGKFEGFALCPTGGGFNEPTKMGNLYGP